MPAAGEQRQSRHYGHGTLIGKTSVPDMLCQSCQKREATCHVTSILGDLIQKRDLCPECFEAISPGAGTWAPADSPCQYCGGQAFSGGTDLLALLTGIEQVRLMCVPCNAEFQRYTLRELAALPEGLSHQEQLSALRSLRDKRDAHMRQWVSDRRSANP